MKGQTMTRRLVTAGLLALALGWLGVAQAGQLYDSFGAQSPKIIQPDDTVASEWDQSAAAKKVTKATLDACERLPESLCVTEERYLTIPIGGTTAMISADQLYKSGPGYVRGISCSSDALATAGTITLRDNTAAGAGNILWEQDIQALAYTPGMIREDLHTPFAVGLYLDFTTTADVKCIVRFR